MKVNANKEEIEEYLKRWQDILRLRDWDIVVKIVKTHCPSVGCRNLSTKNSGTTERAEQNENAHDH